MTIMMPMAMTMMIIMMMPMTMIMMMVMAIMMMMMMMTIMMPMDVKFDEGFVSGGITMVMKMMVQIDGMELDVPAIVQTYPDVCSVASSNEVATLSSQACGDAGDYELKFKVKVENVPTDMIPSGIDMLGSATITDSQGNMIADCKIRAKTE